MTEITVAVATHPGSKAEQLVANGQWGAADVLQRCVDTPVKDGKFFDDRRLEVPQPLPHLPLRTFKHN